MSAAPRRARVRPRPGRTRVPTRRRRASPSRRSARSICASRSPKYPVTTTRHACPGAVRLATAASMPDVPVPEIARLSAPGAAPNVPSRRARMSSRIAIISGSRWLSTGADMARMTRADTGLGPGPSSNVRMSLTGNCRCSRTGWTFESVTGLDAWRLGPAPSLGVSGTSGARGSPPVKPARSIAALRPGDAEPGRDERGERRQPPLQVARLAVTAGAKVLVQPHAERRQHARDREDGARRADAERRVERGRRAGEDRERAPARRPRMPRTARCRSPFPSCRRCSGGWRDGRRRRASG